LVGAAAAFLQAGLIILSVFYVNKQFGILRACAYIERFDSHESIRRRGTVDRWLTSSADDTSRIEAFDKDAELQADILGFLNLFQELGVAFSHHGVHKRTVRETFDFIVPHYWQEVRFLVEHLRTRRRSPLYRRFELMAHEFSIWPVSNKNVSKQDAKNAA
jgi:hypothetical protein